jgi:hypothetical protein
MRGSSTRRDLTLLGAVCAGFASLWLAPYVTHPSPLPIGADALVYLWWSRMGGTFGLPVLGLRGGAPAILLTLSGALHMPPTEVFAGAMIALAVAVVPLAAGLARRATDRAGWLAPALLAGAFVRFLVWGYLANLAFTVVFLSAVLLLSAPGDRRSTVAAALVLGAGGLLHPQFLLLGAAILVVASVVARWRDRGAGSEPRRALLAAGGGLLAATVGLISLRVGPQALPMDTAPDAILRAAGLTRELVDAYRVRFEALVYTDGLWLVLEGAFATVARATGFVGRVLGTWGAVTLVVLPFTFFVPLFAGQRLVFFGFFLPILAGIGLMRIARRASRSTFGRVVVVAVLGIVLLRTAVWWWSARPYVSVPQLAAAESAARIVASLPAGTSLVFVVHERDHELVLPSKVLNTLRVVLPADRGEDVRVYFGPPEDVFSGKSSARDPVTRALQQRTLDTIGSGDSVVFVLRPFDDQVDAVNDPRLSPASSSVAVSAGAASAPISEEPHALSRGGVVLALLLVAGVLCLAGYGWASSLRRDRFETVSLTPACGLAAIVIAAITVERLGIPLSGSVGPTVALALAIVPGYVLTWRSPRRQRGGPFLSALAGGASG